MIFGRKNDEAVEADVEADASEDLTVLEEALEADDSDSQTVADSGESDDASAWAEMDAAFDREWGPFDFEEVDLEADDVKRLDLGTLVVTPFEKMTMQLQVDKAKERVQAILVADGASALEVAVFAGPVRTSLLPEIREEIIAATEREKGQVQVVRGPFGAELRRRLPVTDPKGNPAIHVSRTWLVDGPGWVLRGVLMGKAALNPKDEEAQLTLFEFFSNLVVRRGTKPAAPGSLLPMSVPTAENQTEE
ncbi:DUF3710 domain-containing protein [Tessaracoccus sp. OS52]|uniref:DUF3710 domain-containing protein n=1 Tax=Tessaracoccus sp. OS52 TaxID=2886691 RepID=UPI001D102CF6|nr:DUF3710 domain-containing protein [Tessaracoccus sp. OS52]